MHPHGSKPKIKLNSNDTKLTDMARAIGSIVNTSLRCSGKAAPIAADVSSGAALFSDIFD